MNYRIPELPDHKEITLIHLKAFKNFFLSDLGQTFLNTYYKAVIKSNNSITICAESSEGEKVGFATGAIISRSYNQKLILENFFSFSIQALRLIFIHPKAILRLIKNFNKNTNELDDGNYAELFSIAVLPEAKGLGIGRGLIENFELIAKSKGCKKVSLTTDYYHNDSVIEFYEKNQYKVFYEFIAYPDRRMYKMIKEL